MGAACAVAAIGLAATAFMLRFLMALLFEAKPSECYLVIPRVANDKLAGGDEDTTQADAQADWARDADPASSPKVVDWHVPAPWPTARE